RIDYAENRRICSDAQGERQNGDGSEAGVVTERSHRVTQVMPKGGQGCLRLFRRLAPTSGVASRPALFTRKAREYESPCLYANAIASFGRAIARILPQLQVSVGLPKLHHAQLAIQPCARYRRGDERQRIPVRPKG